MTRRNSAENQIFVLAQGIAEGRWPPNSPLPAVRALAIEMGISKPTMIKSIRLAAEQGLVRLRPCQPALVLPEARQVAEQMLARRVRPLGTLPPCASGLKRIAVLHPDLDWPMKNPAQLSLCHHIDMVSEKAGLQCERVPWPHKDQVAFALSLPALGYSGAICVGMRSFYQVGLTTLRNQRFPTVLVNRRFRHLGLPVVTVDDYRSARETALRLISMGHRSLSLVADLLPSTDMEVHGAIRGWVDGLNENNVLDECHMPVCILPDLPPLRTSPRTFERILLSPNRPTALLFYQAEWPSVILGDARFAQFRVPDDISLVLAVPGQRPPILADGPPLTTLDFDYDRTAACIIEIITDLLVGKAHTEVLQVPLKLNLTESIGLPPGR